MRIPEGIVRGCVAMLSAYCPGLTEERFLSLLVGEGPRALKPLSRIAADNRINKWTLIWWMKKEGIRPAGKRRGVSVYNEREVMDKWDMTVHENYD
ncbi:MAG: hypothetical protein J6X49_02085 [Victivallales bacterium]|nr:hypothetical protein [Victivallales bacterium]